MAAACCLTLAGTARAQTTERTASQLFGRAPTHGEQQLDVSLSAVGAYDDNIVETLPNGGADPRTQSSGAYDGLMSQTRYSTHSRHVLFAASELSTVRYYPSLSEVSSIQHAGAASLAGTFGQTRIAVSQSVSYAPYFSFAQLPTTFEPPPGVLPIPTAESAVSRMDSRTYATAVDFSQAIGARTTLRVTSSLENTDVRGNGTGLKAQGVAGRVVRNLTRDFGIVLGYGYQQGIYRVSPTATQITTFHDFDIGIDYHRALSVTRRAKLSFTTGSTMVQSAGGISEYRVIGDARLTREIGRTWQIAAAYHRGVGLVDGFGEPFFQDALILSLGGGLSRRLELSTSGGYSKGQLGIATGGAANNNDNYNASAHLRVALSRTLAFSTEYAFYQYRFDRASGLPPALAPQLRRQSVRCGLELWLPLIH